MSFFAEKISKILLGVEETTPTSYFEKVISALGGFLAILIIIYLSKYFIGSNDTPLIVASAAASVVLVFGLPQGTLSQPWPLIGGHLISAIIGVTCSKIMPENTIISASLTISLSIFAMYFLRCLHPPGGATALTAVIGSANIQSLGYYYILTPVLLNIFIILCFGIIFNYFFPWRRYPIYFAEREEKIGNLSYSTIEDLKHAFKHIERFADVTEKDLIEIHTLATQHCHVKCLKHSQIQLNHYYSNGECSEYWSIRQVIEELGDVDNNKSMLAYKIIIGKKHFNSKVIHCTREEFAQWAKYEVVRHEKRIWRRC